MYVPRYMVWKEEEAQKSHLFGDLKHITIAIDFRRRIYKKRVHISRNQQHILIGGQTNSIWQKTSRVRCQYGRENAARAVFSRPYLRHARAVPSAITFGLSPYRYRLLVSEYVYLVLTDLPSKINGYSYRL